MTDTESGPQEDQKPTSPPPEYRHVIEHGSSPEAQAVRVLRKVMCNEVGRGLVEHGLVRPFRLHTMPADQETYRDAPGIVFRADIGWHAACRHCGENLTRFMNEEIASWYGGDTDGAQSDADCFMEEHTDCPECGKRLVVKDDD